MHALILMSAAQVASDDGLTFGEMLADIPHDTASLFVYVLLAVSIGAVVWAGRRRGPRVPPTSS